MPARLSSPRDEEAPRPPRRQGDAPLWLEYARAMQAGEPFELGLPMSTTLCSEVPYLVLTLASLWFVEDLLAPSPPAARLAVFCALNGIACLFRAEHLLFTLPALLLLAVRWERPLRRAAAALLFLALPLVPWHARAWSAIRRFNEEPRTLSPIEEKAVGGVEQALRYLPWDADALRQRDALPAFARRTASAFVLATVWYRGGSHVSGRDFGILEEAFGYTPKRLGRFPFVTLYGPLNFALANHTGARGGFERAPLEQPPPLAGGAERYPPFLVRGLPPPQLTFFYPPHLRLVDDGYAIGWRWVASHPADYARLAARKLALFGAGAASGATGWGWPLGLSGRRPAVDMVVPPRSALSLGWGGLALLVPVLALLAALVADRWLPAGFVTRLAPVLLALALLAEGARALWRPAMRVDGVPAGASDPVAADDPRPVELSVAEGSGSFQ